MQKAIKNLCESWKIPLNDEWSKPYFQDLKKFIKSESSMTYPSEAEFFSALNATQFKNVKVVILGQDPYHGEGQAHGLSFSVPYGVKVPPSLRNIYKEIYSDIGEADFEGGNLQGWANQGVLLLNAILSVKAGKAGSHQKKGWEIFTDKIISSLNDNRSSLVFMLWGSYAQKKGRAIDTKKHLVLQSVHPSPLSAYRGFLGCKHFSKANKYLVKHGKKPIDWLDTSC